MNELREQVQGLIDKHDVDSYRASVGAEHSSYPSAAVTTDRIIAIVREALLQAERDCEDGVRLEWILDTAFGAEPRQEEER